MKYSPKICGNLSETAIKRDSRNRSSCQFVDGEPVREHLLEAPSIRTCGNGMVRETTPMVN